MIDTGPETPIGSALAGLKKIIDLSNAKLAKMTPTQAGEAESLAREIDSVVWTLVDYLEEC